MPMLKPLAIAALIVSSSAAQADDHMIRPTCWEENKGDHVERHCSVNGKDPAVQAPRPRSSPPQSQPIAAVPEPLPPPQYPINPCAPYACGYGHPSPRGAWYAPPPYYGPPPIVFGIGPLTIVIP